MKLRNSFHLGAAIALAAQITGANAAEQNDQLFFVTPSFGFYNFDNDRDIEIKDHAYGALGFGIKLCNHYSLESSYRQVDTEADNSPNGDFKFKQWNAGVIYSFDRNENLQPYVVASLGDSTLEIKGFDDNHDTSITFGTGAKFWLNKNMAIDTGVRLIHGFDDDHNEPAFNLGLVMF